MYKRQLEFRPTAYDEIYPPTEGLARVRTNGRYGYIDLAGKEALPAVYEEAFPFNGGFATARLGGKYGFIDRETLIFKEKPYIGIGPYNDGLAPAQGLAAEGRCGYIDRDGAEVIAFLFTMCASFDEGLAPVLKELRGSWGYIDKTGREVTGFKYTQAGNFSGGLAKVAVKDRVFYIDRAGKEYTDGPGRGPKKGSADTRL